MSYIELCRYVSLSRSHMLFYVCPYILTFYWNMGFLLLSIIFVQIVSGILLALQYTSNIIHSYYSVIHLWREVYYGWCLHYMHSNGVSSLFSVMYFHIGRGLYINCYLHNTNLWLSGVFLFMFFMMTGFIGYVITWGQMSFWGGTVITNILSIIPCSIAWMCGGFYVSNPTLKRFFIYHLILSILCNGIVIIHLYYLHYISNTNPLGYNINNFITFYPYILYKDIYSLFLIGIGYTLHIFWSLFIIWCSYNSLEVEGLLTPLHIVPEWYFLHLYMVLKAIPNKTSGLTLFILCSLVLCILVEVSNISSIIRLSSYNWIYGNLLKSYFVCLTISTLFIGAQLPQVIYLSNGRALNVLMICIICSSLWFPYQHY